MTDGFKKLRKAARRERWLRPAKRPTVAELLKKKKKVPGFIKKLKKKAKSIKNALIKARNFDWDKYKPLVRKIYNSSERISSETGLPFLLVASARALDFLEPANPIAPIESRTITKEKLKKYGMPPTMSWMNVPILLRDVVTTEWIGKKGWLEKASS